MTTRSVIASGARQSEGHTAEMRKEDTEIHKDFLCCTLWGLWDSLCNNL